MVNNKKLGICWGNAGISLVELNKDIAVSSTFVPFNDVDRDSRPGIRDLSADLRLLENLQRALRSGSFSVGNAFFSLPSKDIIVRWFIIPWVKAEEIQGMVAFEAKKYIPFPLEDLFFNYYPTTITKDGARQIGIALTAIRKTQYEHYCNVLLQAGVNVVYSEPSAMSLLRSLVFRKLINTEKVSGILVAREDSCEIAVVSKGFVRFIRDFSLQSAQTSSESKDDDFFRLKLFNEVKMSLDFFSRNNATPEVERIVAISSGINPSFLEGMHEDLGLPVDTLVPEQILEKGNNTTLVDLGYVRAFGAALSGAVPAVIDFNLSEGNVHGGQKKPERVKTFSIPPQALLIAAVACGCLALLALSWWWMNDQLAKKQSLKVEVSSRLGRYLEIPKEDIDNKVALLTSKINAIKSLSLKSSLAPFFVDLVTLLPKEAWLDSVEISYDSTNPGRGAASGKYARSKKLLAADYYIVKYSAQMTISGFVFLGDTNAEFNVINQFVETLKNAAQVKRFFSDIKLKSLQTTNSGPKQTITAFTIEFQ